MLPFHAVQGGGTSTIALAALASYLLGGVPFGLLLAKGLRGVDLREVGSGNIGATNTMRVLGRAWGVFAFLLDFAKGWAPVFLLAPWAVGGAEAAGFEWARLACGAAAVLGHCFPVYLGFRGGKGVATGCGAIVAVDPIVFLIAGVVWLATAASTRFVGLSSMLMGITFPIAAGVRLPYDRPFLIGCLLLATLILVRHKKNIARMIAGTEPRMGRKKEADATHG